MKWKHVILAAAMSVAPLGSVQGQKNNPAAGAMAMRAGMPAAPQRATVENHFYVTIRGTTQGAFKGGSALAGNQDKILGLQFLMQVTSQLDQASGQAAGKRQFSPITITKEVDEATPQLFAAVATNEVLKVVDFEFVRVAADGKEEVYETIKLTNATISSLKDYIGFPDTGEPPDPRALEDVSFTFQKIEITNNPGKTSFTGLWGF